MKLTAYSALSALAFVAACAPQDMPEPPEGAALFARNCAVCHGSNAQGGAALVAGKLPPDLTRISARNGGTFPRARVLSQIDGYGRGKVSSEVMPEFGLLLEGDYVPVEVGDTLTPTPRPLAALLAYLESIQLP